MFLEGKQKKPSPRVKQDEGLRFRYTTHYNIPTYASPITAGNRLRLLRQSALSACDSRGIFCFRLLAPGFHCPRLAAPFGMKHTGSVNVFFVPQICDVLGLY